MYNTNNQEVSMLSPLEEKMLADFVIESNAIENITRPPLPAEVNVTRNFLRLKKVQITDLEEFVQVCAPDMGGLRSRQGMNNMVGGRKNPPGGADIEKRLKEILRYANNDTRSAWEVHTQYELLHPFMDGNGRSGRVLWLWQMRGQRTDSQVSHDMLHHYSPLSFLRSFYYQTLSALGEKDAV